MATVAEDLYQPGKRGTLARSIRGAKAVSSIFGVSVDQSKARCPNGGNPERTTATMMTAGRMFAAVVAIAHRQYAQPDRGHRDTDKAPR
jgi:hypothetical protein